MDDIQSQLPTSRHFWLQRLAEGVFAAIHKEGGWAIANAGIIDLGDRTLVFDTFLTPQAAADLRAAAEELTGRPVATVVNSHYHNDHIWGNQVFSPQAEIVASDETRRLITSKGWEEYNWHRQAAPARLAALQDQYARTEDEAQRHELNLWITYYQGLVEAFPILKVRAPDVTFAQHLAFHGSQRLAEMMTYGGGHTDSDVLLHLPEEGIVFMGDLLFVGCHPYLSDGDPEALLRILNLVSLLRPRALVPGHGPVGTLEDLEWMRQYIVEM